MWWKDILGTDGEKTEELSAEEGPVGDDELTHPLLFTGMAGRARFWGPYNPKARDQNQQQWVCVRSTVLGKRIELNVPHGIEVDQVDTLVLCLREAEANVRGG